MLEVMNNEYLDEVMKFAESINMKDNLQEKLDYLSTYAERADHKTKCELLKDWAPYSFGFAMYKQNTTGGYTYWFSGGLIFHGIAENMEGYKSPTFSATLTPVKGWVVHT